MEQQGYYQPYCQIENKFSYSWREARYELNRMKKDGTLTKGFHLAIYFCKKCGHFHVGSQANKVKTAPRNNSPNSETEEY